MDVSILIRTKNEADHIGRTLELIQEQAFQGSYEVIVIDSESTDGTRDIAQRYGVRLLKIPQHEFTYGRSLNLGVEKAKGEFVANLSAHAFPANSRWLDNLISGFHDPRIAGVYGRQISDGTVNPVEALQNGKFFGPKDCLFRKEDGLLRNAHFSNSNSAIRRDVWQRFRFNEQVPYAEDTLWLRQVIEAGFFISYKAGAIVYHTHDLNPFRSYRNSKCCAFTLASIDQKSKSLSGILTDLGIFWSSLPVSMARNMSYAWHGKHWRYLAIIPFTVVCLLSGWLVGRTTYKIGRGPLPGETDRLC